MYLHLLLKLFFHSLPALLLLAKTYYLACAALLLVCLAYIKVGKLSNQIKDAKSKNSPHLESIEKTRKLWAALTFDLF